MKEAAIVCAVRCAAGRARDSVEFVEFVHREPQRLELCCAKKRNQRLSSSRKKFSTWTLAVAATAPWSSANDLEVIAAHPSWHGGSRCG